MRKGKIAAQAAHASMGVFTQYLQISGNGNLFIGQMAFNADTKEWFENSFTKICVGVDSVRELLEVYGDAKDAGLPCKLVVDNGATEFNGVPTMTCCAIGPAKSEDIDKITGHLKLL